MRRHPVYLPIVVALAITQCVAWRVEGQSGTKADHVQVVVGAAAPHAILVVRPKHGTPQDAPSGPPSPGVLLAVPGDGVRGSVMSRPAHRADLDSFHPLDSRPPPRS